MVLLIDAARILRWNDDSALDFTVAHIFHSFPVVVVIDGDEGANIGPNGIEGLTDFQRLRPAVLVHNAELGVANLSAEGVAQHNQLHQRKYHRRHHQRR